MRLAITIPAMPPADPADLLALSEWFGGPLPTHFENFLRDHDGARPEENTFDVGRDQESGVNDFIPAGEMLREAAQIDGFRQDAVPIAIDGCGNYVYLEAATGKMFFWDHEIEDGDVLLASTFERFLALLRPFDPASVALKPSRVISAWIDPDFKSEFD